MCLLGCLLSCCHIWIACDVTMVKVTGCCYGNRHWGARGGGAWEAETVWPGLEVRPLHRYHTWSCQRSQWTFLLLLFLFIIIIKVNVYRDILCWYDGSFCLVLCRNHSSAEVGESPAARPEPPQGRQRAAAANTHTGQARAQVYTHTHTQLGCGFVGSPPPPFSKGL